jgi:hypothetical protein
LAENNEWGIGGFSGGTHSYSEATAVEHSDFGRVILENTIHPLT